ncbi:hypothetical protein [Flavobacterium sp.]|jgi:tetratricopeptide (TPR) repeat protein|uniref:tetratricopeptide repeat protein n=1 Tax=Flavobacterium sp. TaxID=239 RepID=UPI002A800F48|nr:hypothetical protein [Flavobacterium sp.]
MKTKLTLLFAIATGFFAQAQSPEACTETLSLMASSAKAKDPSAYEYLTTLRKDCPSFHNGIYTYGEFVINQAIDKATTPADKEKYVRDLLKLYDEHDKNFPNNGAGNQMKKAMTLFENNIGTKAEAYQLLENAFKTDKTNFDSPKALYTYFELFVNDYEAANKGITLQQVFDKYDDISEKLTEEEKELSEAKDLLLAKEDAGETLSSREERSKNKYEINLEAFSTVIGSMDSKIVELSTCEKLIPFYQKGFEENKNNEVWLKRAADRLEAKECDGDPLFSKISEALYRLNPSADAAYKLGIVELQRKNTSKALDYFNKAADMFTDNSKKAFVYYRMATMYSKSNKSQSRAYARKALAVKPSYGKAYLLIAQLYGSSINDCGNNPFDKRAMYWLAAQYADKAGNVDTSLKGAASKMAGSYRAAAPSRTDIFESGKAGERISFNCWVGESITVPKL